MVKTYRVMFDNGEETIVAARKRTPAFYKAKRLICKQLSKISEEEERKNKLDSMAAQSFQNARIVELTNGNATV